VPDLHPTRSLHRRTPVALAALALVVAGSLSGCTSAVEQARAGGDGSVSDGGTLHLGVATDLQTATPFSNASDATNVLIGLVYDTLVDIPADSVEPKPSLATSWKLAPGGKSLTLQLRKGVRFHTGRALTSKDVAFSIKTWADPAWAVQFQRTAAAITSFDTSKPDSITLGFAHPLSNVFDLLDNVPIIDQDTFAGFKAGTQYVGTGPFEFGKWTPGSELTFTRNAGYWGGKPHLAAVDTKIVSDPQSLVSQLRSGQLDAIIGGGNRDLESLRKGNRFDVERFKGAEQQVYVGANLANPDLGDVRLRKAIAYAVDRPRVTQDVFRGAGYPVNLPWPTYSPAYDAKLNHTYDRDVA
jgi:peptide/nickel transport system substrate-binding protein